MLAGVFYRSFWRAGLADAELEEEALNKLLPVLFEGNNSVFAQATPCTGLTYVLLFTARGCLLPDLWCRASPRTGFGAFILQAPVRLLDSCSCAVLWCTESGGCYAIADAQSDHAACAPGRWLARNAAGITKLTCGVGKDAFYVEASVSASLVSCLPALEDVRLVLFWPLIKDSLGCLLEALAGCPRLRALDLSTVFLSTMDGLSDEEDAGTGWPFPDVAAFEKLHSLTKLALAYEGERFVLADIVRALAPLTGLSELSLGSYRPAVVPAALGKFKGLRSLALRGFGPCALEAGCLELPNLLSLEVDHCESEGDAQMLPGVTSLQCLTRVEILGGLRGLSFDPLLVQLPHLQRLVFGHNFSLIITPGYLRVLSGLPADMGLLSSSLLHADMSGLRLTHFPLALAQLTALQSLDVS